MKNLSELKYWMRVLNVLRTKGKMKQAAEVEIKVQRMINDILDRKRKAAESKKTSDGRSC